MDETACINYNNICLCLIVGQSVAMLGQKAKHNFTVY